MRKLLLSCWGLFFLVISYAQTTTVTGKITDEKDGTPIIGATIKSKGGRAAAISQSDGAFSITVEPGIKVLVISFIGYLDKEVTIAGPNLSITLSQSSQSLSEVVVVGYGTRLKRDITGSVAKVGAKELNNTPVTSFESAIQGRASGVYVQQQNGKLGQGINIRIRGASSVSAGNEPLYVVDGVPVITADLSSNGAQTNPLSDLNINDIQSIEILKDASAAAIYGSRASNGVVLITTKKGATGTSKIELGYFTGFQKPTGKREFLDAKQFVDYTLRAADGAANYEYGLGYYETLDDAIADWRSYAESRLTRYSAGNEDWRDVKVNTNWQDQAFQDAPISQYDLNFSGGNEKTKFYASGQYLDQDGILVRNSYKRYNGRLNLDHKVKDWLSVGMNMSFSRSQNNRVSNDDQFSTPLQIVALSPITPIIDPRTGLPSGALDLETGAPNTNYPVYYNPLLSVDGSTYKTLVNRTLGNFYGNINIVKGLTFRTEFGIDQLNQTEEAYYGTVTARNTGVPNGSGFYSSNQLLNINTNNFFQYTKTFKEKHSLDVVAGMSFQKQTVASSLADGEVFPSDAYKKLASAASKVDATSASSEFSFLSYFLRANYKFNDKYLLALSGRYDGSSRFGENNRYGFFPAASVGWIISEEHFLENVNWLSFLKLKASYGLTGNAEIGNFASRGLYSGDGAYGGAAGQRPTQIANPDLKWETTNGVDFGIEGAIFNNRIGFEVDYYERNTKDLLLDVEIPGTSGFATQLKNIGNLKNKGVEFSINTTNISSKNFKWTSTLNFGANKNKITNLGGQVLGTDVNKAKEGQPLGVFFTKEFAGADPNNGDALYYLNTVKEDGSIDHSTTNDYNAAQDVVVGNPNPDFIYGFGNTVSYKGIDLDVLLQGVYGNQIYNNGGQYMSASGSNGFDNQTTDQLGYWDKPGDISMVPEPRMFYANGTNPSSRYISNGSYLRVKAVTLGYNLPSKLMNHLKIEKARIYIRAQNLFTITNYKGWDPEVNADWSVSNINQGQDFYSAPQLKTIVFGINISL
ncbi:TonB-dependent receptor [Panacibacter ginsenosidivorans]|uniref:TonB-dependent receptor n=1 Tax=Panacibacter ginsenosidivorans TaxID=1813871 RepID=A0A5B8VDL1_9BACT|nr:TonB-dependent receptor [Panacibacter ginsenosidivorans]QEC69402.1 TonB-dependent receptor [Panacibacter ginsenosidivorans]